MTENETKRKRGGQPGNRNARKYDAAFYTEADYALLNKSYHKVIAAIDKDARLLRAKIKSILRDDPENYTRIVDATNLLGKLTRLKQRTAYAQKNIRFPRLI
jgi:hypothetical protein